MTLSPNGELKVTVSKELSGELCGLCGNYDGAANDDLRDPDGKLVPDFGAAAKAWRAPDFSPVSGHQWEAMGFWRGDLG